MLCVENDFFNTKKLAFYTIPSPIQTLTVGSGITPDPPLGKLAARVTD